MKVKNILIISLLFILTGVSGVSAQILSVSADPEAVTVGKELIFSVKADSDNVLGIQFDIKYDDSILEYVQANPSEFFDNALAAGINADNSGSISALMAFAEEQEINGELLSVTFKVKKSDGSKAITVDNIRLAINDGHITEDALTAEFSTKGKAPSADNSYNVSDSDSDDITVWRPTDKDSNKTPETPTEKAPDEKDTIQIDVKTDFTDISGHWAEESIKFMAAEGIINGFEDKTFAPDINVKRSEFAAMISKALALEEEAENCYSDVAEDAWYKEYAEKCTAAGIIEGSDGQFRPEDLITREEMAVIIYRSEKYFGLIDDETAEELTTFRDDNEISIWAKKAVAQTVNDGIIKGMGDNCFCPKLSATRAQAAVVLEKLLRLQWSGI